MRARASTRACAHSYQAHIAFASTCAYNVCLIILVTPVTCAAIILDAHVGRAVSDVESGDASDSASASDAGAGDESDSDSYLNYDGPNRDAGNLNQ